MASGRTVIGSIAESKTWPLRQKVTSQRRKGVDFFLASVAVFAGPHEEVESSPDNVRNALCSGVAVDVVLENVIQDGGGEKIDSFWWRVHSSVAA